MNLDYISLDTLRRQHPAWRLLAAEHAALVASFLHRSFITPNVRVMAQADLAEALENPAEPTQALIDLMRLRS